MVDVLNESIIFTAILSWFIAQLLKVIIVLIKSKKIDFYRFIGSGGMPSSHAAFVVSLATSVGLVDGFDSSVFAVTVVLAMVVMYDAAGVRRSAGQMARILNKIVDEWDKEDGKRREKRLKELLGHTPVEVFAGALLGILIGIIRHF